MSASAEEKRSLVSNVVPVPVLSPDAPAFIPTPTGKKLKKDRAGPRKRRRKKQDYLDFDTSDLLERSSQGSNASSTPSSSSRRNRERGDKSYVPLYKSHFGELTNMNLSNMDSNLAGDWLTGLMGTGGGGGQPRFRSGSNASDLSVNRSSLEWLDMQTEWSQSKQLVGSSNSGNGGNGGASASSFVGLDIGTETGAGAGGTGDGSHSHSHSHINSNSNSNSNNDSRATSILNSNSDSSNSSFNHGSSSSSSSSSGGSAQDEAVERKRWSEWAISAAEMERFRRMVALDEIDRAEARERLQRRKWAINAIEEEKNERLSANFLTNLTSTNWFHEAISSQHNRDYDVVCPYYKLGCRVTCKKSDIESHVKSCSFAGESSQNSNSEVLGEDYECVCPNAVLGCRYTGGKKAVQQHLNDGCAHKGKTRQQEQEERHLMRHQVIHDCEEERVRRLTEDKHTQSKRKSKIKNKNKNKSKNKNKNKSSGKSDASKIRPDSLVADSSSFSSTSPPLPANTPPSSTPTPIATPPTGVLESSIASGVSGDEDSDTVLSSSSADQNTPPPPPPHMPHMPHLEPDEDDDSDSETESQDIDVDTDKGDQQILTLHLLMEKQMNHVVTGLHNEALQFWEHWREKQSELRPLEVTLIQQLQHCIHKLWNFASLEPFGSWATGLPGVRSDIDLVVCFEDDILLTKTPTSRTDLLRKLAHYLEKNAKSLITITKVLLHTRVPLIKASARISVPCHGSSSNDSEAGTGAGIREVIVELDISIDGPEHSGLATTSLSQAILKALPGLGPATMLIKEYLKEKRLCDSFTGGLASYGIFLLVSLLFLRRYHANQLAVVERQHPSDHQGDEGSHNNNNDIIDNTSNSSNSNSNNNDNNDNENNNHIECESTNEDNESADTEINKDTTPLVTTTTTATAAATATASATAVHGKHTNANKSRGQGQGQGQRSRTLDKSFSSEFLFADTPSSSSSPPLPTPPSHNNTHQEQAHTYDQNGSITASPSLHTNTNTDTVTDTSTPAGSMLPPLPPPPPLTRSSSDPLPYSFINVKQQKEYGRRVAAKLLLNPADYDTQEQMLLDLEASLAASSSSLSAELSDLSLSSLPPPADDPDHPLKAPMLGVIIVEFLGVYGEEMQCGRHGFSVRDGGFRFDVQAGPFTIAHPQANDPMLIEDPVNVMNNVAQNCFNALAVQRVFLEAHDKFKSAVTRYSASGRRSGSVIDEVFGLSLTRAADYTAHNNNNYNNSSTGDSNNINNNNNSLSEKEGQSQSQSVVTGSGCPTSPARTRDYLFGSTSPPGGGGGGGEYSSEILLYRKRFPGMSAQEASEMLSTLPQQLLDDIVRSKHTSAGVILGVEFQKVLHEMLLNQESGGASSSSSSSLSMAAEGHTSPSTSTSNSPGRSRHKHMMLLGATGGHSSHSSSHSSSPPSRQTNPHPHSPGGRRGSTGGIASSPKSPNRKKKSPTKNTSRRVPLSLSPSSSSATATTTTTNTTTTTATTTTTTPAVRTGTGTGTPDVTSHEGQGKGRSESF